MKVLPFSGGMYEQPARIIEIFNIIRNGEIERDNARREMEELKNMNLRSGKNG
jgi:hypothetical protein